MINSIPQAPTNSIANPELPPEILHQASVQIYEANRQRYPDDPIYQLEQRLNFDDITHQCAGYSSHTKGVMHTIPRLVRVLFLMYWHNWSLRITERQVQNDLRVKQFAGYALHEFAPDSTTICRFDQWVSATCPRAFFDAILEQADQQFPHQRTEIQKGDTFAMIADAARESLVTLIRHSSQRLLRDIAEQKGWAYEQVVDLVGRANLTGEEEKSYHRMTAEERAEQLHTAVSTAYASLDLQGSKPNEAVQEWVGHLEKLLADNLHITWQADGQLGEVTRLPSKEQGSYRMGSATDPEATYRKHDDQDDLGYNISTDIPQPKSEKKIVLKYPEKYGYNNSN